MAQLHPATEKADRRVEGFSRIRRYETARIRFAGSRRTLLLAALTALLVVMLLAAAIGQALSVSPTERAAGASQDGARPADTFDWEQWDRARLAPYQPADSFDWEQWERTQTR